MSDLVRPVLDWYAAAARDLPWRHPGVGPWAVLVSEVMLQQTPVARVLPVYTAWIERWPTPAALAAEPAGEAVRMWGRMGYPRRALSLHRSATLVRDRYGGRLPADLEQLEGLPGVGTYTARAIAAFAYGQHVPVVDTNVRRLFWRAVAGHAAPLPLSTRKQLRDVAGILPADPAEAGRFSVALMELGALICTARAPRCDACPIADLCVWRAVGYPPPAGPPARTQTYAGTDRQVRGLLLAVLRDEREPVSGETLNLVWHDAGQRERALASLLADGLVTSHGDGTYALPT